MFVTQSLDGDPATSSAPSPYDDPTPCPECGTEDAEYGLHNAGCPSGYPAYDPEIDEMQKVAWEMEESAHGD